MNGAGHAATAEGLLVAANKRDTGAGPRYGQFMYGPEERALLVAEANAHAALAHTAAVLVAAGMRPTASVADLTAWPAAYDDGQCTHGADCPVHPDARAVHNFDGEGRPL